MLIIFSRNMAQNSSELESLVFETRKDLQHKLMHFLNEKVFIEDDDGECLIVIILYCLSVCLSVLPSVFFNARANQRSCLLWALVYVLYIYRISHACDAMLYLS